MAGTATWMFHKCSKMGHASPRYRLKMAPRRFLIDTRWSQTYSSKDGAPRRLTRHKPLSCKHSSCMARIVSCTDAFVAVPS